MNSEVLLQNGEVIKIKAKELLDQAIIHLRDNEKLSIKFSKGWMVRFKKRQSLRFYIVHGKEKSSGADAIRREMPQIHEALSCYAEKDVWNADEFGSFYRQAPS